MHIFFLFFYFHDIYAFFFYFNSYVQSAGSKTNGQKDIRSMFGSGGSGSQKSPNKFAAGGSKQPSGKGKLPKAGSSKGPVYYDAPPESTGGKRPPANGIINQGGSGVKRPAGFNNNKSPKAKGGGGRGNIFGFGGTSFGGPSGGGLKTAGKTGTQVVNPGTYS